MEQYWNPGSWDGSMKSRFQILLKEKINIFDAKYFLLLAETQVRHS